MEYTNTWLLVLICLTMQQTYLRVRLRHLTTGSDRRDALTESCAQVKNLIGYVTDHHFRIIANVSSCGSNGNFAADQDICADVIGSDGCNE